MVATSNDLPTLGNASKMKSKRPHQGRSSGRDLDGLSPNKKRGVESYAGLVLDICDDGQDTSTKVSIPSDVADPSCGLKEKEPDGSGDPKPDSKVTGSAAKTPERKERKKGDSSTKSFSPCTPKKGGAKVSKYTPNSLLTDVKGLLSTRLLEGLPVNYKRDNVVVHGFIKYPSYLCGCSSCNYEKVVSANEFKRHVKVVKGSPNSHIFLESGISLYKLVKELKNIHLHSLDKVIEEKIGCAPNLNGFEDWKESFQMSHDLPKTSINGEKIQQNQTESHGEPHSIRSSKGPAIESITGSAPSIMVEFNSEGPATEVIIRPAPSVAIEDSLPCPTTEGSSKPDSSVSKKFSSSGPDTEIDIDSVSSMNVKFTAAMPDAEGSIYPASNALKYGPQKCSVMESKPQLKSRTAKRIGLPKSPANALQQKNTAQGGTKKRDHDLHCLIFKENGLPDGSKLTYHVKGKDVLIGYKSGNGILCSCCKTEVNPSQFEAHAGLAATCQPYHHIYTSDGLSLHKLSISLLNGQHSTAKCCECIICGDGGILISCHTCLKAFHAVCLKLQVVPDGEWNCPYCIENFKSELAPSKELSSAVRSVDLRLRRILKDRTDELEYCVLCKDGSFSTDVFNAKTCVFCAQCDRLYHIGCLKDPGSCNLKEVAKDKWFCSRECETIHAALHDLVNNGQNMVPESLMSILKRKPEERNLPDDAEANFQWQLLSGKDYEDKKMEEKILLRKATLFFQDAFHPIECGGHDLIPAIFHGLKVPRSDCSEMYCAVLSVKSDPVSAGVLRVFGQKVAELPLVVTHKEYRVKGYFRTLLSLIESLLSHLRVEILLVSVDEDVQSIWINKLGFAKVTKERLQAYLEHPIMMFERTTLLEKAIPLSFAHES